MSEYLCHDFKTPRTDTARRLPDTFRFIPLMFYVAMLGGGWWARENLSKSLQLLSKSLQLLSKSLQLLFRA